MMSGDDQADDCDAAPYHRAKYVLPDPIIDAPRSFDSLGSSQSGILFLEKDQAHHDDGKGDDHRHPGNNYNSGIMTGTDEDEGVALPWKDRAISFYHKEALLIEVSTAIFVAYLYPSLGADYMYPDITAHWVAVIIIFFLSGFCLHIGDLTRSMRNMKFNVFVILYNFLFVSFVTSQAAKFFYKGDLVSEDLMKGMIICGCLPMPTNMTLVLTMASKGDEASALFLATFMNLAGVFVTPILILFYMEDAESELNIANAYKSISLRVLLPVAVGMLMKANITGATEYVNTNKEWFQKFRERCLVFVVYATFCLTFENGNDDTSQLQFLLMATAQIILLISVMFIAWILLFMFFTREPKLRVMGLFGCTTKTAALGIPLISAIYGDHPKLGMYTLPLLIWYPSQLIFGTIISSRLARFVDYKTIKYEMEMKHAAQNEESIMNCGDVFTQETWE